MRPGPVPSRCRGRRRSGASRPAPFRRPFPPIQCPIGFNSAATAALHLALLPSTRTSLAPSLAWNGGAGVDLFTRDLRGVRPPRAPRRVRGCEHVMPLFVLDDGCSNASARRTASPSSSMRWTTSTGGCEGLEGARVRRGEVAREVERCAKEAGADRVDLAEDVTRTCAGARRLSRGSTSQPRLFFRGVTCCTGRAAPSGRRRHAFSVFTPYWSRWREALWLLHRGHPPWSRPPARHRRGPHPGTRRARSRVRRHPLSRRVEQAEGRRRLDAWLDATSPAEYRRGRDHLASVTPRRASRRYLRFGPALSPLEVVERCTGARGRRGVCAGSSVGALLHDQLFAARPEIGGLYARPAGP